MSAKPKAFLKKTKHRREQKFETADDFQAAGVDFEDAAGKWRAGDAVKSMRFFQKALEVYDQGLAQYPSSLDLAYNKARVQLEVATHPILVRQLQSPLLEALREALESHRFALGLDQQNADTLFNTAQVLTSIAEELAKDGTYPDEEAARLLEEALELQSRCLSLQEQKHKEMLEQERAFTEEVSEGPDGVRAGRAAQEEGESSVKAQEEQWFSVVEAVTYDTLIDTVLAQLGSLTTLCGIIGNTPGALPSATLSWIEDMSSSIIKIKLPSYTKDDNTRNKEIALVCANFVSAFLEASFKSGKLDAMTYRRERDVSFSAPALQTDPSMDTSLANAQSLLSFVSAVLAAADSKGPPSTVKPTAIWESLVYVSTRLATASKLPDIASDDLAKSHLLRGDAALIQHRLRFPPIGYSFADKNATQLLKNASIFYNNASKIALEEDEKCVALLKAAVVSYLQSAGTDHTALNEVLARRKPEWVYDHLSDMADEALIPQSILSTLMGQS